MTALDLRAVARALGGEVAGRQVLAPGPNHSRRDRSLSVRLSHQSPTGFVVHSHSGDAFDLCRDYVAQRLGLPLDAWRTRGQDAPRAAPTFAVPEGDNRPDDEARIARAVAIWDGAVDAHGTVVERYLAGRGLELPDGADVLRFHPRCPWGDKALGRTVYVPAMVAAMRQVDGDAVTAVHRTRLSDDGRKLDRMMLGKASGAAIKLDGDDEVTLGLHLAEGIETALSGRHYGFRPCWALGSASAIERFPVLAGVECVTFLAERDDANARAVEGCAARWHRAGRKAIIVEPTVGNDLNDALRGVS